MACRAFECDHYLSHSEVQVWLARYKGLAQQIPGDLASLPIPAAKDMILLKFLRYFVAPEESVKRRNKQYCDAMFKKYGEFFDHLEAYPLTYRQREAIVYDADNCLVVAGAGTGKTSTLVGKVGFVLRAGHAAPEEILVLAFARKAAAELEERITKKTGAAVEIKTFHSLGLQIIAETTGSKPTVAKIATDLRLRERLIQSYVNDLLDEEQCREGLTEYLANYLRPCKDRFEFKSDHEHMQYLKTFGIRSLKGEQVKSLEEQWIANWLFLNGVEYVYENPYEHPTATVQHSQYKPDFYLPEYGIYIEHYGVNREGDTAPGIDKEEYLKSREWKRELHSLHETTCIETFSYMHHEGRLRQELKSRLVQHGVEIKPMSKEEIKANVATEDRILLLTKTICTFLSLYKSNQWSLDEVRGAISARDLRAKVFVDVFEPILARYTSELEASGEVDFEDMIQLATEMVESKKYTSRFRYVIVDEFQDIARGRARLIRALLAHVSHRRLFCVGDDWQSIYRFAGSDIAIMTEFEKNFGYTRRTNLEQTFRFSQELASCSTRFVEANPKQLRKKITGCMQLGHPAVKICTVSNGQSEAEVIQREIACIRKQSGEEQFSTMLLGRYHFVLGRLEEGAPSSQEGLPVRRLTVHAAKGLEADYVFVLGMMAGTFGFPSEIVDDPLLHLVLAASDDYPNAEERRLFFVALTRARRRVFLLAPEIGRSAFVQELERESYHGLVESSAMQERSYTCPICHGGRFRLIEGQYGRFWACENYPYCDGKLKVCPECEEGPMILDGSTYRCGHEGCDGFARACPECMVGILCVRKGPGGEFLGCSNWRPEEPSCGHTEPV